MGLLHLYSNQTVIVKKIYYRFDFRVLVIDKQIVAAAKLPAHVVGNSVDTIQQLILT
jgi:D-alanine-D-alanine ligase-like ATP-grasp enzyme